VSAAARRHAGGTGDTAQEASLQSFLHLANLHEPSRFGAWLHAIAANLARMALRQRTFSLDTADEGAPVAVLWAARLPTPEEAHAAREVHDAIIAALKELSAVNREAILTQGEQQRQVDARPSDALALAARVDAPIYATQSLLDTTAGTDDAAFWERQKLKIREYHQRASDISASKPSDE
jgi:hypothetical protein